MLTRPEPSAGDVAVARDIHTALAARLKRETEGEVLFERGCARPLRHRCLDLPDHAGWACLCPGHSATSPPPSPSRATLKVPVLPRGAGTSQCGQTTGAALVIDTSKYLRRILDVDVMARTASVEPGLVLDHLNAALKPHGLWFPVDVSTSAQATLGGMAGNNSCGSRSIAYGNMVHNVLGATRLAVGRRGSRLSGRSRPCTGRAAQIADFVRDLAPEHRGEIERDWPKVLRRVGGYNLDIFDNQSERPYTTDGSVNLAHLLVGSEGTLAFTRDLTLQACAAAARAGAGRGQFPHLPCRDGCRPAYRQARSQRGGAGRPHHDRTQPVQSRLPPHHRDGVDRPARRHPAGGIRRRRQGRAGAPA